jgi:hypothetical protein
MHCPSSPHWAAMEAPLFEAVDRAILLPPAPGRVSGCVCGSTRTLHKDQPVGGKRPEHCDLKLLRSGAAAVTGNAVRVYILFPPQGAPDGKLWETLFPDFRVPWHRPSKPPASHCHRTTPPCSSLLCAPCLGGSRPHPGCSTPSPVCG